MLQIEIEQSTGIAILSPDRKLTKDDFINATKVIDEHIDNSGKLNGLIIYTESFPGWSSFQALLSHLNFVKNHHHNISRVALVTDSAIGSFAENIIGHFIAAKVQHFSFAKMDEAKDWAASTN